MSCVSFNFVMVNEKKYFEDHQLNFLRQTTVICRNDHFLHIHIYIVRTRLCSTIFNVHTLFKHLTNDQIQHSNFVVKRIPCELTCCARALVMNIIDVCFYFYTHTIVFTNFLLIIHWYTHYTWSSSMYCYRIETFHYWHSVDNLNRFYIM